MGTKQKGKIKSFFSKYRTIIFWSIAAFFFILSFIPMNFLRIERQARHIEKSLQHREKILDKYIAKTQNTSKEDWLSFEDFPEDMVIYKYVNDTLQSWINQFPINNDDINILQTLYRINDLTNTGILNTPLAFLSEGIQYVNLGPAWYIVKVVRDVDGHTIIIGGIEIKTEYSNENSMLQNMSNPHLHISSKYTTVPLFVDNSNVISSKDGTPLFSIIYTDALSYQSSTKFLRWFTFLFAIIALFSYQIRHKTGKSCIFTVLGLCIIEVAAFIMISEIPIDKEIVSPMLYAGGNIIDSLGKMLVSHVFIFLYTTSVFMSRNIIIKRVAKRKTLIRNIIIIISGILTVLLFLYIHFTLESIIQNSNIVLDIYRINMISKYTVLVYICYTLLFFSVLIWMYMIYAEIKVSLGKRWKFSLLSTKFILIYITAISLYTTIFISVISFRKEYDNLRILTGRFAVERDLSLEIQLQAIERHIINDPLIKRLTGIPNSEKMITNRLAERYFWNIFQKYDMHVTICQTGNIIITDDSPRPMNCFEYFGDIIQNFGVPLSDESAFYYLDYFKNKISYLGAFSIFKNNTRYDLYIEIDSKRGQDDLGYPALLTSNNSTTYSKLPFPYSMAKYHNGKITSNQGSYNFPVTLDSDSLEYGFIYNLYNGHIQFINKISENNVIVVNRPHRKFFTYLIFLSYVFLFFGIGIFLLTRLMAKNKKRLHINRPKHSFRMKITILLTTSMVVALIFMAVGSVILILRYINSNDRALMEEKLASVQSNLTKIAKTSEQYDKLNSANVFTTMDIISKNNQVDINLFDNTGRLIRTTRPEVFNEYLVSARMNSSAYYKLVHQKRMQVVQEETISTLKYYSLYTPIYNEKGNLLAIANLPYFVNDHIFKYDASSIIAAIINLYLILMIVSILIGIAMSNSLSKPLKEIGKSMEDIDITHKLEHINYKENNELGMLVKTYNKMIDDLEQSTKDLAQSEREQAWREMARQIAHEIKNPLTPMKLSIQHMVRMKHQNVPNWQDRFESLSNSLIEQIDILSNTASEFSSFAKFYNEDITEINLAELIMEQKIFFDNNDNIEMEFRADSENIITQGRKSQLTRALVNLISNAIQALENKEDGKILITLKDIGDIAEITIEDNGNGVSEENMPKLFTPNFTTKTKGNGLGLAICKNIVTQSRGDIFYKRSEELGGADFIIHLPICLGFEETQRLDT